MRNPYVGVAMLRGLLALMAWAVEIDMWITVGCQLLIVFADYVYAKTLIPSLRAVFSLVLAKYAFYQLISAGDGEEENDNYVLLRVPNKDGDIPLHEAVRGRNRRVIEALLRADPKSAFIANKKGESPLYILTDRGFLDIVDRILLFKDLGDMEEAIYQGPNGQTPLHAAVARKNTGCSFKYGIGSATVDILEKNYCPDLKDIQNEDEQNPLTLTALRTAGAPRGQQRPLVEPNRQHHKRKYDEVEYYKERINTLALIATQIATLFLICSAIAMYSSIIGVVVLIWAQWGDVGLLVEALRISLLLLGVALTMMAMAFASAIYLVVNRLRWVVVAVLLLTAVFLLCIVVLFVPLRGPIWSKHRGLGVTEEMVTQLTMDCENLVYIFCEVEERETMVLKASIGKGLTIGV
ncbi:PGG domain [Dillenia turbinata]|uniref:PGG domain n=1 Tax=Dillenia turbinata TaxID=194707 RepID=A0AAN8ZAG7_9MAGN